MEKHLEIKLPYKQTIDINNASVHIKRKNGLRTKKLFGSNNLDIAFDLHDIESIEWKRAGFLNGYIRFIRPNIDIVAETDPYSFQFNSKSGEMKKLAEELTEYLNRIDSATYNSKINLDNTKKTGASDTFKNPKNEQKENIKRIKDRLKQNKAEKVGLIYFDFIDKKVCFDTAIFEKNVNFKIVNFSDIVSFTPIERNGGHVSKHHRGTRALIGGMIAGGTGAVIGASTGGKEFDKIAELSIIVHFKDGSDKKLFFINDEKSDSLLAQQAQSKFDRTSILLTKVVNANKNNINGTSYKDELEELKALLDEGIITQEEFTEKKKQVLGL